MKKGKKKRKLKVFLLFSIVLLIFFLVLWVMNPENLKEIKGWFLNQSFKDYYNAESLLMVDLSNDEIFVSKNIHEKRIPASLAKLFVVDYALTLGKLDDVVKVSSDALSFTKPNSSIANIKEKEYYFHNLIAAMLVPSGNDAAYVVADYCVGILEEDAKTSDERIQIFMDSLNQYLEEQGYLDTILYDPSGFDMDARTTVMDLKNVAEKLLEYDWFLDIVSKSSYTAILPDGSTQTWHNTNVYLDSSQKYYNENVIGIKTGSLDNDYNLVVLYQQHNKMFLICSLGSKTDSRRYEDVNYVLKTIDESDYLKY